MAETKIIIHDYRADESTGRIELHLKSETTEGNCRFTGPVKQYSVDPQMLRDRFNGSLEQFEAWAVKEHAPHIGVHPDHAAAVEARKGMVIA